jgi:hypothetical protein
VSELRSVVESLRVEVLRELPERWVQRGSGHRDDERAQGVFVRFRGSRGGPIPALPLLLRNPETSVRIPPHDRVVGDRNTSPMGAEGT